MTTDSGVSQRQLRGTGAHRTARKRSKLTRTIAAGGAVVCIGAVYEITAPTVHALSIVFRTPQANGTTNELRVDLAHGNIFDPQLAILGNNVSNNSTSANGTFATANNPLLNNFIFNNPIMQLLDSIWNREIVIGGAAAGPVSNVTQISFLSFNIFNPQASIFGGNLSRNTANSNIASGYGNNGAASATSIPNLWTSWFGGMTGNGNAFQLGLFSGNIFNPQYSIFGPNVSNNTAVTNVATDNGNDAQTSVTQGGGLLGAVARLFFGGFGGMTGNGNTTQVAVGTSNITNPQVSLGGSNQSNNTAITNEATGNGNNSQTTVDGSGNIISVGTTGNGNTNQTAVGTSNIENTQVSVGDIGLTPRPETLSATESGSRLASTSTTPTSSSGSSTTSLNSSVIATSGQTSSTSEPESGSGTAGSGTTGSSGDSGGSGGSGDSGGSGGGSE